MKSNSVASLVILLLTLTNPAIGETWSGLMVKPEFRCSPYYREDYRYPPSVEYDIVDLMDGRIYSPYSGTTFQHTGQTDIEHIVAISEAHDSGMCARSLEQRRQFARDLDNLTLASPGVNRHHKRAYDAAEWLPQYNKCWYVNQILAVKREYKLTVDAAEARAIEKVLARCDSTKMIIYPGHASASGTSTGDTANSSNSSGMSALDRWDDNKSGRITCAEARRHGLAPVQKNHPAYKYMRDGDGDGVVCE